MSPRRSHSPALGDRAQAFSFPQPLVRPPGCSWLLARWTSPGEGQGSKGGRPRQGYGLRHHLPAQTCVPSRPVSVRSMAQGRGWKARRGGDSTESETRALGASMHPRGPGAHPPSRLACQPLTMPVPGPARAPGSSAERPQGYLAVCPLGAAPRLACGTEGGGGVHVLGIESRAAGGPRGPGLTGQRGPSGRGVASDNRRLCPTLARARDGCML